MSQGVWRRLTAGRRAGQEGWAQWRGYSRAESEAHGAGGRRPPRCCAGKVKRIPPHQCLPEVFTACGGLARLVQRAAAVQVCHLTLGQVSLEPGVLLGCPAPRNLRATSQSGQAVPRSNTCAQLGCSAVLVLNARQQAWACWSGQRCGPTPNSNPPDTAADRRRPPTAQLSTALFPLAPLLHVTVERLT